MWGSVAMWPPLSLKRPARLPSTAPSCTPRTTPHNHAISTHATLCPLPRTRSCGSAASDHRRCSPPAPSTPATSWKAPTGSGMPGGGPAAPSSGSAAPSAAHQCCRACGGAGGSRRRKRVQKAAHVPRAAAHQAAIAMRPTAVINLPCDARPAAAPTPSKKKAFSPHLRPPGCTARAAAMPTARAARRGAGPTRLGMSAAGVRAAPAMQQMERGSRFEYTLLHTSEQVSTSQQG